MKTLILLALLTNTGVYQRQNGTCGFVLNGQEATKEAVESAFGQAWRETDYRLICSSETRLLDTFIKGGGM